jgi:hypothetical protein
MPETRLRQKVFGQLELAQTYEGMSREHGKILADALQTHELKDQKLVAQLTSRELAEGHHFVPEEDVQVQQEPEVEPGLVRIHLHQDETDLVNGSIVFDEHGQAYRYYASESSYQAAYGLAGGSATQPERLHETAMPTNVEDDTPTSAFTLGFRLGNAAPRQSLSAQACPGVG